MPRQIPTDNVGYSPFVDIVMPATGDAPPLPDNGISFSSGSATYNGMNLRRPLSPLMQTVKRHIPLQKMLLENHSSFRAQQVMNWLSSNCLSEAMDPHSLLSISISRAKSVHWPSPRNPTTSQQQEDIDTNLTQVGIQLSTTQTLAPPLMIRYSHSFFD